MIQPEFLANFEVLGKQKTKDSRKLQKVENEENLDEYE